MSSDSVTLDRASREDSRAASDMTGESASPDVSVEARLSERSGEEEDAEGELLPRSGSGGQEPAGETRHAESRRRVVSGEMSGPTKAAVFILSLKEEAASSVLRCLSDEELSLVAAEIAQIGVVDKETVAAVMGQFLEIREASEIAYEGGVDPASRLLERSLPTERAAQLTELLMSRAGGKRFAFLSEVDAASLVACLAEERPQTIAVVLAQMNPARAADVLERFPSEQRKDVIRRIASLDGTSEECVRLIEQVLRKHFDGARFSSLGDRGGVKAAAEILRAAEEQGVSSFFDDLREEKPDLAEEVSKHLFDFNDLARFDDRLLARALERVDPRDLALALKNSGPKLAGKVAKNLSRKSADRLRESGERLGPVRLSESEAARSLVLERILSLDDGVWPLSSEQGRHG